MEEGNPNFFLTTRRGCSSRELKSCLGAGGSVCSLIPTGDLGLVLLQPTQIRAASSGDGGQKVPEGARGDGAEGKVWVCVVQGAWVTNRFKTGLPAGVCVFLGAPKLWG